MFERKASEREAHIRKNLADGGEGARGGEKICSIEGLVEEPLIRMGAIPRHELRDTEGFGAQRFGSFVSAFCGAFDIFVEEGCRAEDHLIACIAMVDKGWFVEPLGVVVTHPKELHQVMLDEDIAECSGFAPCFFA